MGSARKDEHVAQRLGLLFLLGLGVGLWFMKSKKGKLAENWTPLKPHKTSNDLVIILALLGAFEVPFQIYTYLFPDSSKLSAIAIYSWIVTSTVFVLLLLFVISSRIHATRSLRSHAVHF